MNTLDGNTTVKHDLLSFVVPWRLERKIEWFYDPHPDTPLLTEIFEQMHHAFLELTYPKRCSATTRRASITTKTRREPLLHLHLKQYMLV